MTHHHRIKATFEQPRMRLSARGRPGYSLRSNTANDKLGPVPLTEQPRQRLHTLIVSSLEPDTSTPSGENATLRTPSLCSDRVITSLPFATCHSPNGPCGAATAAKTRTLSRGYVATDNDIEFPSQHTGGDLGGGR